MLLLMLLLLQTVTGLTLKEFTSQCLDALKASHTRQTALEEQVASMSAQLEALQLGQERMLGLLERMASNGPSPLVEAPPSAEAALSSSSRATVETLSARPTTSVGAPSGSGLLTSYYAPTTTVHYVPSRVAFPPELGRSLRGLTMSVMMRTWFVEELFNATVSTARERKVKGKFAQAVHLMRYFLPRGTRIEAKPTDLNMEHYAQWARAIDACCSAAEAEALKFCEKHRSMCATPSDGSDDDESDSDTASGSSKKPGKKKRKRSISTAFNGLHKRLSTIHTQRPDWFVEPENVVIVSGWEPSRRKKSG